MKKTLALVMIVKNEEKGLEKAILSAKPFVNEIVIAVDNSSQDKTLEIAKKYADVVKTFKWNDNFAEARNFAHKGVKSDYILFLDGHEYIDRCEILDQFLNKEAEALIVNIRMESGMEFKNPRIYKNGLQFMGRVHENQARENAIQYPFFTIQHDRLNGQAISAIEEREKQRKEQVPRIMKEEVKKNKRNLRALFHLALFYHSQKEHKKSLYWQKRYLKHSKQAPERYFVHFIRAMTFLLLNRKFRAFWAISRADLAEPNRWETEKLKGMIFFEKGEYFKAIQPLVNSFKRNKQDFTFKPWRRDDGGTWNLIGESYFRLKIYDKASISFKMASDTTKDEKQKELFKKRAELMANLTKR